MWVLSATRRSIEDSLTSTSPKLLREVTDNHGLPKLPWDKNPKIGWWDDHDHITMYHGTHQSNLHSIDKNGIHAPSHGPTAGWVSMALEPHTSHGYASMSGGESNFRAAGARAHHVPDHERAVLVARIPKTWAKENMNPHLRGNIDAQRDKLTNRDAYEAHAAAGRPDHEHYAMTELRFKNHVPRQFIVGYTQKPSKPKKF